MEETRMIFTPQSMIALLITSGILQLILNYLFNFTKNKLETKAQKNEIEAAVTKKLSNTYDTIIQSLEKEIQRLSKRLDELEKVEAEKWSLQAELAVIKDVNITLLREKQSIANELETTKFKLMEKTKEYDNLKIKYNEKLKTNPS